MVLMSSFTSLGFSLFIFQFHFSYKLNDIETYNWTCDLKKKKTPTPKHTPPSCYWKLKELYSKLLFYPKIHHLVSLDPPKSCFALLLLLLMLTFCAWRAVTILLKSGFHRKCLSGFFVSSVAGCSASVVFFFVVKNKGREGWFWVFVPKREIKETAKCLTALEWNIFTTNGSLHC